MELQLRTELERCRLDEKIAIKQNLLKILSEAGVYYRYPYTNEVDRKRYKEYWQKKREHRERGHVSSFYADTEPTKVTIKIFHNSIFGWCAVVKRKNLKWIFSSFEELTSFFCDK